MKLNERDQDLNKIARKCEFNPKEIIEELYKTDPNLGDVIEELYNSAMSPDTDIIYKNLKKIEILASEILAKKCENANIDNESEKIQELMCEIGDKLEKEEYYDEEYNISEKNLRPSLHEISAKIQDNITENNLLQIDREIDPISEFGPFLTPPLTRKYQQEEFKNSPKINIKYEINSSLTANNSKDMKCEIDYISEFGPVLTPGFNRRHQNKKLHR